MNKSISDFSEAHREDLESECRSELEVLKKLLPEPVNELQIYSELRIWAGQNKLIEMYLTEKEFTSLMLLKLVSLLFLKKKWEMQLSI